MTEDAVASNARPSAKADVEEPSMVFMVAVVLPD